MIKPAGPLLRASSGDAELARRCASRDRNAITEVIASNNQRLFRAAWSILRNRSEAEEAVQSAYMQAFAAIGSFEGRSSLATWLTRIVINEALGKRRTEERRRRQLHEKGVAVMETYRETLMRGSAPESPDVTVARAQIRTLLEQAVAALPETFRTVFVLREIEGLSVEQTAEVLGTAEATVKTRLFRARRRMQELLAPELGTALRGTFPFAGADCAALTVRVLDALGL